MITYVYINVKFTKKDYTEKTANTIIASLNDTEFFYFNKLYIMLFINRQYYTLNPKKVKKVSKDIKIITFNTTRDKN
jgi:hypothetical protein